MSLAARIGAIRWWRALWRPLLAYLAAVLAAVLAFALLYLSVGIVTTGRELALLAQLAVWAVLGATVLAAVPTLACLAVIRSAKLPRGCSEVVFGALVGTLPALAGLVRELIRGSYLSARDVEFLAEIFGSFTFAGSVGGLAYWLAIGRPGSQIRLGGPGQTSS